MNAKKCKALRKMLKNAEKMSGKEWPNVTYREFENRRKYTEILDQDAINQLSKDKEEVIINGSERITKLPTKKIQIAHGQLVLAENCFRGKYQHLKQKMKSV